jgi:hypothetical protein
MDPDPQHFKKELKQIILNRFATLAFVRSVFSGSFLFRSISSYKREEAEKVCTSQCNLTTSRFFPENIYKGTKT